MMIPVAIKLFAWENARLSDELIVLITPGGGTGCSLLGKGVT